ncbi:hypothetical protein P7K49_012128 [Saguinus oedipus]|uniref:Uncharacterized protein n=1 Tax=Saguinus oedipus TaxID=9490 RepID=A0ABQ9VSL5_SAGOE|nr:hypothetical protein P7K49_012128 [Saguinus oedipus]
MCKQERVRPYISGNSLVSVSPGGQSSLAAQGALRIQLPLCGTKGRGQPSQPSKARPQAPAEQVGQRLKAPSSRQPRLTDEAQEDPTVRPRPSLLPLIRWWGGHSSPSRLHSCEGKRSSPLPPGTSHSREVSPGGVAEPSAELWAHVAQEGPGNPGVGCGLESLLAAESRQAVPAPRRSQPLELESQGPGGAVRTQKRLCPAGLGQAQPLLEGTQAESTIARALELKNAAGDRELGQGPRTACAGARLGGRGLRIPGAGGGD